jgi:signal transduction histidine kinase
MLLLKVIALFIAGGASLLVSAAVAARDIKKLNNLSFSLLAFSLAGWAFGIASFMISHDAGIAFSWAKVYYLFPLLIGLSLYFFSETFPDKNKVAAKPTAIILLAFAGLSIPLLLDHTFLTTRLVYHSWGKEIVLNRVQYGFYAVYLLVTFSSALYKIWTFARKRRGLYAAQASLFFNGFLIAATFGIIFNLILPAFGNYRLIWIGPLFTTTFITAIAFSIARHRMFDLRLVIARSLAYLASLAALAALYGFVVFGLGRIIFGLHVSVTSQVFLSTATGVASLSFQRLRRVFDAATNRLFYQDAYDPQEVFDNLNRIALSTLNTEPLLLQTATLIASNLKAEYCLVGLEESKQQRVIGTEKREFDPKDIAIIRKMTTKMHQTVIVTDYIDDQYEQIKAILIKNRIAILVRLSPDVTKDAEGLGYIVLGYKKSGNPYNQVDYRVLDTISKEVIIALQNALRFEQIQNFNATLQQKVEEATHKLRNVNRRLTELDETKDDFISMASHQLRTPLTSVKGYLSLVLDGDTGTITETQRKMLGQAFTSSQRMVYLIADLLNVSRLKTGKFLIQPVPINLATLVSDEIAQLTETAASRELNLVYNKPENFPELMLDETKTRQVIMNFVDNAIYYTPAHGTITIELLDKSAAVELRVVDDGIGVPKAEQHHLFTKFYRAGNARKARPDGTGLGLFMAKKVIVAQGGALIFESAENKGSVFGFTFSKSKLAVPTKPLEPAVAAKK